MVIIHLMMAHLQIKFIDELVDVYETVHRLKS